MNHDIPFFERFRRVNRSSPCPICEKPDWCLVARDGSAAVCQRVESQIRIGEAGWLHRLHEYDRPQRRARRARIFRTASKTPDFSAFARACQEALRPDRLDALASQLRLTTESLLRLHIGWSTRHNAWSFPMTDARGRICGVRLRLPGGRKFAVTGSKEGLFLPDGCSGERLIVTEGPTDTAALIDMSFPHVVGRPSCTGGVGFLVDLIQLQKINDVTILADGDVPGRRGATKLAQVLVVHAPVVRVIEPPEGVKDARDWLARGATGKEVEAHIATAAVLRLTVESRRADRGK
jgi:hypothetical protein